MKPSFTQWCRLMSIAKSPMPTTACMCQSSEYDSDHGEFAHARARTATATSNRALPDSVRSRSTTTRTQSGFSLCTLVPPLTRPDSRTELYAETASAG